MAPVQSAGDAVRSAQKFLQGKPGEAGPFSVRADQDYWVVFTKADDGSQLCVYVDFDSGKTAYYSEEVVDVAIIRPE